MAAAIASRPAYNTPSSGVALSPYAQAVVADLQRKPHPWGLEAIAGLFFSRRRRSLTLAKTQANTEV
jgi:hypothetical protein